MKKGKEIDRRGPGDRHGERRLEKLHGKVL